MVKIQEMPRIRENTEMFTIVPVKRGVGVSEIESKGISRMRGTVI